MQTIRRLSLTLAAVALFAVACFQSFAILLAGLAAVSGAEIGQGTVVLVGVFAMSLPGVVNLLCLCARAAVSPARS